MCDILYDASIEYGKLKDVIYKIVVGRKGKAYILMLHFPPESFFHLAGLQHLKDLTFPSKNKERIYKEIVGGNLTIEDVRKSVFFEEWFIEERLQNFQFLEQMIDSDSITYLINAKRYITYTEIKADYLCERIVNNDIIYLFLVKERRYPKFKNECKGCSYFRKHDYDYTIGTAKTTTLLIEKIENGKNRVVFRNPVYVEQ